VVITAGGSGGGVFSAPGALLASQGIAALCLAYFGVEGLPPHLKRIPLEYFGAAIQWCGCHPLLRTDSIGIAGGSRGAELALLVAASYPEIVAVVGWSASGVMWPGLDPGNLDHPVAAWTWEGKDLPFALLDRTAINWKQRPLRFTPAFIAGLSDNATVAEAEIPVERIQGPVLLISGSDDQVWPSSMLSDVAINRLRRAHHPFEIEHLCYEGAGHAIGPPHPYGNRAPTHFMHPTLGIDFEFGGSPELNAHACKESWARVIGFLRKRFLART